MSPSIPFNRSHVLGNELENIRAAVSSGQISGDQSFTKRCQELLESDMQARRVLLATSCTHALEMAALLLDIRPGDEVILPSFTFVSTANAFVLRGAKPIFADVRPDTLNLDETRIEALISERTRAIIPVHYAGIGCAMATILEIAARHDIVVVEDNAHGLYGKYQGQWLGTIGALATQSFHATKNFYCGEGGALVINQSKYLERAEILREKGTDRSKFFRGEVAKYSWVDLGSSYVMSDLLAAYLFGQLQNREKIQGHRAGVWQRYQNELRDWCQRHDIRQPFIPPDCEPAWHLYFLIMPSIEAREALIAHLAQQQILAVTHYLPLHLSTYAERWGGRPGDCPVTEHAADHLVRLPLFNSLSERDQTRVIEAVISFTP
jgi:dTDP-4-amino-4,6-dideoxygalactose transaminase